MTFSLSLERSSSQALADRHLLPCMGFTASATSIVPSPAPLEIPFDFNPCWFGGPELSWVPNSRVTRNTEHGEIALLKGQKVSTSTASLNSPISPFKPTRVSGLTPKPDLTRVGSSHRQVGTRPHSHTEAVAPLRPVPPSLPGQGGG